MGTTSVSNSKSGLHCLYTMSSLDKKVVNEIPTIILLLHFCFVVGRPSFATGRDKLSVMRQELKKDKYGYQQCVKWYRWSILI
jgi:hypothetical protein